MDPDETLALGFDSVEGPGDAVPGDTVVRLGDLLRKTAAEDVEQVSGGRVLADDDRFRPGFPSEGPVDFCLCRSPAGLPAEGLQPLLCLLDRLTAEDWGVVDCGHQVDVWDDDGAGLRTREGLLTERPEPGIIEGLLARQCAVEPGEAVHHGPGVRVIRRGAIDLVENDGVPRKDLLDEITGMDDDFRGWDVLPLRDLEEYLLHDGYGVGEVLIDTLLVAPEGLGLTDELVEVGDREVVGRPEAAVTFRGPLLRLVGVDVASLVGPRAGLVVEVSARDRKERVLHLPEGVRSVDREQRPYRSERVASGQTSSLVPTAVRGVRVSVAALFCGEQVAERCVGDTLIGRGCQRVDGLEQGLDATAEMKDIEGMLLGEPGLPRTCTGDALGEPEHVRRRIHQTTDPGDDLCSCGDVDEVLLTVPHEANVLRDEVIVGPLNLIVEVCEEVRQIVVPAVPCIFDEAAIETYGVREVSAFDDVDVGEHVPCPGHPSLRGSSADGLRGVCDSCRTAHLLDGTAAERAPDMGSALLHDLIIGLREPFAPAERIRVPGVCLHELHSSGEVMKLGDDSGCVHELEEAADCNRHLAAVSVELGLLRSDLGHPAVHGTEEPRKVPGLDGHAVRGAAATNAVHEVREPGAYPGTTEPGDERLGNDVLRTGPVE